ncbi:hypothetical protein Q427_00255 [Halomonas sp. BC04]|nr:hypothetical protein Q427_00255 [Halomonas sp. BC04]
MASAGSSIEVDADPGEPLPPIRLAGEGGLVHGLASISALGMRMAIAGKRSKSRWASPSTTWTWSRP